MASVSFMGFVLACTAPGLVTSLACSERSEVEGAVRKILVSSAVAMVNLSTAVCLEPPEDRVCSATAVDVQTARGFSASSG